MDLKDGIKMPIMPFGTEIYYDCISRLNGDNWPDEH